MTIITHLYMVLLILVLFAVVFGFLEFNKNRKELWKPIVFYVNITGIVIVSMVLFYFNKIQKGVEMKTFI